MAQARWYPDSEEVTIPWNATYTFPSQGTKAVKSTPRISPKNGAVFVQNQTFRLEFPAQGYVNGLNTTISFDVTLAPYTEYQGAEPANTFCRFQDNIQSCFQRARLMYGSTPMEDIQSYGHVVRSITQWTTSNSGVHDQTSLCDGIGGYYMGRKVPFKVDTGINPYQKAFEELQCSSVRQDHIQGVYGGDKTKVGGSTSSVRGVVPNVSNNVISGRGEKGSTRRYSVQLALGFFGQGKLIPTKFMASQLAIEVTLTTDPDCIFGIWASDPAVLTSTPFEGKEPTYALSNIVLLPEILEFDASYDALFIQGLQQGGVPIKYSTWHTFIYSQGHSAIANIQIQERSRSVKAIFAVLRRSQPIMKNDSGASFGAVAYDSTLNQYQFRIGGRMYPASPVVCAMTPGVQDGSAEAFIELQKALNILGDYRLSTSNNNNSFQQSLQVWGDPDVANTIYPWTQSLVGTGRYIPDTPNEADFLAHYSGVSTKPNGERYHTYVGQNKVNETRGGSVPSTCFAMAVNLETSSGEEISGLNAEEQSDISLIINWSKTTDEANNFNIEVFTFVDQMAVLKENNVIELIY
jgi:hypothetical protein